MTVNANAIEVIKELHNNFHEAVLAGGCVRDMILGHTPKDWDIATSATPDEIEKIFKRTIAVGKSFGVITVLFGHDSFEVATFRTDGIYSDGRHPSSISFSSMKEDALRRDLTINGMFYDIKENKIIDFVDGQYDLNLNRIRFIGNANDRISEDSLRMLRALRFSLRLSFYIDDETIDIINGHSEKIENISKERIRDELCKMFETEKYAETIELLDRARLLLYVLPDIYLMKEVQQNPKWHPEGSVYNHTLDVLRRLKKGSSQEEVWSALFHDVGKNSTTFLDETNNFTSPHHEKEGEEIVKIILEKLKFPTAFIDSVCFIVGNHMRIKLAKEMKKSKIKRILSHPDADKLLEVARADSASCPENLDWYTFIQDNKEVWKAEGLKPEPFVGGRDLIQHGLKPGPQFKEILDNIYDKQLEREILSKEEALKYLLTIIPT